MAYSAGQRVRFTKNWHPAPNGDPNGIEMPSALSFHKAGDEVLVAKQGAGVVAVRSAQMRPTSFYWVPDTFVEPVPGAPE